jgi:hypothetical protein
MQSDVLTLSFLYDRTGLYLCINKSFVEMYIPAFEEKKRNVECTHRQQLLLLLFSFLINQFFSCSKRSYF